MERFEDLTRVLFLSNRFCYFVLFAFTNQQRKGSFIKFVFTENQREKSFFLY